MRFYDPETHVALISVPRQDCGSIRAAISFLTVLRSSQRVAVTTLQVSGSARTAKLAALRFLPQLYREHRHKFGETEGEEKFPQKLVEAMATIRKI